jgi:hypothetical protein
VPGGKSPSARIEDCLAIFPDDSMLGVYNVTAMVRLRRIFCIACLVLLIAALVIESIDHGKTEGRDVVLALAGQDALLLRAQVANEPVTGNAGSQKSEDSGSSDDEWGLPKG